MTFLRQVQNLLERTYEGTGINLEDCLVGRQRCLELSRLAGPAAVELSLDGRTFLRMVRGRLYLAIYYHPWVIRELERHPPFMELSSRNIEALIVFLEEVNHAVHAALRFLENRLDTASENAMRDLELQARVDTYLSLELIGSALRRRHRLTRRQRGWLRRCLFEGESFHYQSPVLQHRYREANRLGLRVACHLDRLTSRRRIDFIRRFRSLGYDEKRRCIENRSVRTSKTGKKFSCGLPVPRG